MIIIIKIINREVGLEKFRTNLDVLYMIPLSGWEASWSGRQVYKPPD